MEIPAGLKLGFWDFAAANPETLALIDEGRMIHGAIEEVFTDERLSDLYGISVRVATVDGQRVILAGPDE